MANWAVVIGIDRYWRPNACLKAAVKDALEMRAWLLDPSGGALNERNLVLLLGSDPARPPPTGVRWTPATHANIITAIETILERSGGQGERFFFHFSGHGLTARIDFRNQSAIVAGDFTDTVTTNSLTVASLFELFKGTQFAEQYFFVDACRNIPFSTETRLGEYPKPRPPVTPVRPQFVMFATQPGLKAIEINCPGDERGAFTGLLLRGLRGAGSAKRWDEGAGEYVVRWNSLFEFVEREVAALALTAAQTPNGPLIQKPQQYGERGSQNPDLARYGVENIKVEDLEVSLDPSNITESANIIVGELAGVVKTETPPLHLPVQFRLPPRTYSVRAGAPGYTCQRRCVQVDLYQPESVTLKLEPGQPPGPPSVGRGSPPGSAPVAGPEDMAILTRGLEGGTEPATLTLLSADRLASLELAEGSGRILASGRSPLFKSNLAPAFYRGRLISPEGDTTERLIELEPGTSEQVNLDASPQLDPFLKELIQQSGLDVSTDNMVRPSEAVGPAASMQSSTVLALAAAAAMEIDSPYGQRLRSIGIPAFQKVAEPQLSNGVQLVLADKTAGAESWGQTEIRIWPIANPAPEDFAHAMPLPTHEAIAMHALGCAPGGYWVWLKFQDAGDIFLPVAVLPGRVSLIVMTRDPISGMTLHQYMPLLPASAEAGPGDPRYRDPQFFESRFPAIRRIELMQRLAAAGRVMPALPEIDALLYDKWRDPMAGCLGGYLLLRLGRTEDLDVPAQNLTKYFANLPDSHVLLGVWLEKSNPKAAEQAYRNALDRGLPLFRDGLLLLHHAVWRTGIKHSLAPLLEDLVAHVPSGTLWSASPGLIGSVAKAAPPAAPKGGTSGLRAAE